MARTTPDRIGEWFDEGVARGATHMIVVSDTWDHEDAPHYVMPGKNPREEAQEIAKEEYTRVMEVYALHLPKHSQLREQRAFHYERPGEPAATAVQRRVVADVGYPDPTPEDLESKEFEAVWQAIRLWDIERDPKGRTGRSTASGNDVMHILKTLAAHDFRLVRRPKEPEQLVAMRKGDVQEMLNHLENRGMSMPYLERALMLPQRTLALWRSGECPADGLALLKILVAFPWMVKVSESCFDPLVANSEFLQNAAGSLKDMEEASNRETQELAEALMKKVPL
jgi:hypothetical protein